MIAAWIAAGELEQDCGVCMVSTWKREQWGCDGPSINPVAHVRCWAHRPDGCDVCGGTGFAPLYVCPNRSLPRGWGSILEMFALWERGFLPTAGGVADQLAWAVAAFLRFSGELHRLRSEQMKRGHAN